MCQSWCLLPYTFRFPLLKAPSRVSRDVVMDQSETEDYLIFTYQCVIKFNKTPGSADLFVPNQMAESDLVVR